MTDRDAADGIIEHVLQRQILPHLEAERMREQGMDVRAGTAYTGPETMPGMVEVRCLGCGKTAQAPLELAGDKRTGICPDCVLLGTRRCELCERDYPDAVFGYHVNNHSDADFARWPGGPRALTAELIASMNRTRRRG